MFEKPKEVNNILKMFAEKIYLTSKQYDLNTEEGKAIFMAETMLNLASFGYAFLIDVASKLNSKQENE